MTFRKIKLEVTVRDEEAEILIHALGDAMDKIEKQVTVFDSDLDVVDTEKPENAEEIAAPAV